MSEWLRLAACAGFIHNCLDGCIKIGLITGVAFAATLLSSMSGGGSSMITTPVWLMLGFPLPVAIASNTVNGSVWTLVAARNYLRGHVIDWPLIGGLVACGMFGAIAGTEVIMHASADGVERLIGLIILSLVLFTYIRRDFGLEERSPRLSRLMTSLAGFPLGFYEAFFGSGNGIFTSAVLCGARGFKLLQALGYYYVMAFLWCVLAATIYIRAGHWDLSLMIPAATGSLLGAQLGSRIGTRKGARFVKSLFIVVGAILGFKLLLAL